MKRIALIFAALVAIACGRNETQNSNMKNSPHSLERWSRVLRFEECGQTKEAAVQAVDKLMTPLIKHSITACAGSGTDTHWYTQDSMDWYHDAIQPTETCKIWYMAQVQFNCEYRPFES